MSVIYRSSNIRMQILSTVTNYALIALVITSVWAPVLIELLYKMNIVMRTRLLSNKANEEYIKIHGHKVGTPDMGGLMISVTVFVIALLFVPQSALRDVFLIGTFLFTLYGFIEGIMVKARKLDEKFKMLQETFVWRLGKLFLLYLICVLSIYLISSVVGINTVNILPGLTLTLDVIGTLIISFIMVMAIYGMEITDGADGLVTGQFLVAFVAFMVLAVVTQSLELMPYLAMLLGSSVVYLYFNINPARVFMGGVGTMPIGFALVLFAVYTNTFWVFIIMSTVFWVELFSSASQIISIRFFKRKLWRIAPIHHHFEAIGWPETKVVQRFWLASAVAALVGLWLFSLFVSM